VEHFGVAIGASMQTPDEFFQNTDGGRGHFLEIAVHVQGKTG